MTTPEQKAKTITESLTINFIDQKPNELTVPSAQEVLIQRIANALQEAEEAGEQKHKFDAEIGFDAGWEAREKASGLKFTTALRNNKRQDFLNNFTSQPERV